MPRPAVQPAQPFRPSLLSARTCPESQFAVVRDPADPAFLPPEGPCVWHGIGAQCLLNRQTTGWSDGFKSPFPPWALCFMAGFVASGSVRFLGKGSPSPHPHGGGEAGADLGSPVKVQRGHVGRVQGCLRSQWGGYSQDVLQLS